MWLKYVWIQCMLLKLCVAASCHARKDTGRSLSIRPQRQTFSIRRKLTRTSSVHLVRWLHEMTQSGRWFEMRGAQADLVNALPWFNLAVARAKERTQYASARDAISVNFYPTIHCDKLNISLRCACALCRGKFYANRFFWTIRSKLNESNSLRRFDESCFTIKRPFPRIDSFEQFVWKNRTRNRTIEPCERIQFIEKIRLETTFNESELLFSTSYLTASYWIT